MRKLAYVVEIGSLEEIINSDHLEVAIPRGHGWKVVVSKGEFNVGDLAVMFEIDSFLNPEDERYAFLKDRCLRRFVSKSGNVLREGLKIKTIKLRGVLSQGLLMPIGKFVGKEILCDTRPAKPEDVVSDDGTPVTEEELEGVEISRLFYYQDVTEEGGAPTKKEVEVLPDADLTELLHVEHYDEVKEQLQPAMGNPICADALGKFPSDYIPKTDEERIQNLGDWFEKMKGRRFEVSVKADGTSCTIAYAPSIDAENPIFVCSRNLRLKPETAAGAVPIYWQMDRKYAISAKLETICRESGGTKQYAMQGEIVGPGIQSDRNKESEYTFKCFRIWDIDAQVFLKPTDAAAFCEDYSIPYVEVLKQDFAFFDEIKTMDEALKFAEGKTAEGNEREGVVLKTIDSLPYASFKIVSNRYLMKQED